MIFTCYRQPDARAGLLRQEGFEVGRLHVATLMKRMGIQALYRRPNTLSPAPGHKIYPYLLRKLAVTRPNQVWTMDITYIPPSRQIAAQSPAGQRMARGFVYLVAVVDWFSRKVLAWRLSVTLETEPCLEALKEAITRFGAPEIMNTDQGSQFTSIDFITALKDADIRISMPLDDCQQSPAGRRWQGGLAGQCLRRTAVADHQIRGGLPAGL